MEAQTGVATFINKVPQFEKGTFLIMKTEWHPNKFNIQIVDTISARSQAWEGDLFYDELQKSAEELEIPYDKFFTECKSALTCNGGLRQFECVLDKKFHLIKKDQFEIKYLEVDIKPIRDNYDTFLITAVDQIASLRNELSACKATSHDYQEKYQTMVRTVEKYLGEKNQIEMSLMTKLAILLNSKKDKVAELLALLGERNEVLYEEPRKQPSSTVVSNSEDFMQPTQVMTQPMAAATLPKRMKLNSTHDFGPSTSRVSLAREAEVYGISGLYRQPQPPQTSIGNNMENSPNIFDQL